MTGPSTKPRTVVISVVLVMLLSLLYRNKGRTAVASENEQSRSKGWYAEQNSQLQALITENTVWVHCNNLYTYYYVIVSGRRDIQRSR